MKGWKKIKIKSKRKRFVKGKVIKKIISNFVRIKLKKIIKRYVRNKFILLIIIMRIK